MTVREALSGSSPRTGTDSWEWPAVDGEKTLIRLAGIKSLPAGQQDTPQRQDDWMKLQYQTLYVGHSSLNYILTLNFIT